MAALNIMLKTNSLLFETAVLSAFPKPKFFYILTSNPKIIRGNLGNWEITRFGHASKGKASTRIDNGLFGSISRKRIAVSMQYVGKHE